MDVAISVRARRNPYTCALSYLSTEPFPYPYKTHQASRSANSSPLFLVTSSVECPPLSEPKWLTTQALPPSLYHPLPRCYRQVPIGLISYGSLPNFIAPTLWFTLCGSTSHTRLLIVLVSCCCDKILLTGT